ncbi:MAG TPA: c-type cytochrome [Chloroflexota bacterium]|nr:c-type cytochrome [Chloroflexota bacterium]
MNINLLQGLFLGLVVVGAGIAALFYVFSLLSVPWRRALSNTDRQAVVNACVVVGIAVLLGFYTVAEPARQSQAAERQLDASVDRGMHNFGQYCVTCHGVGGTGGPVPEPLNKGQQAFAPPLANRADFRPPTKLEQDQKADYLRKTISRGKGNIMPAWSVDEGGALNSQDIEDLVNFIQHGDFSQVKNTIDPARLQSLQATAVATGGATEANAPPGKALFLAKGCAGCHTIDGVSSGTVGPNLTHEASKDNIAGVLSPVNKDNLMKWISNPPAVKPGTAMPNLGLSQQELSDVADYILTLK